MLTMPMLHITIIAVHGHGYRRSDIVSFVSMFLQIPWHGYGYGYGYRYEHVLVSVSRPIPECSPECSSESFTECSPESSLNVSLNAP
jgi:hypothetical protein